MSHRAIAAVLARDDLASGERLVALSLASFANSGNHAWPGAPTASARAGLGRSRYLEARERLVTRGLVVVDQRATGRGRSSVVSLAFADIGPWWEGEINVKLLDAVLGYSGREARRACCSRRWRRSRRGRCRSRPLDRAAMRSGRNRGPDVPTSPHKLACVGRAGARERRGRAREHERLERSRPSLGRTCRGASRA